MIRRVAYLSMHTSPLVQPGSGNAGGMNVYIDELSRTMVERGIEVDVFTRRTDEFQAPVVVVDDGYRVFHVDAGPAESVPISDMIDWVDEFAGGVIEEIESDLPDIVHSHYWLSGAAGLIVKRKLGIPLANSFHTLGRIKDLAKRGDEAPESDARIAAEIEVIAESDCVVAATPLEAADLLEHYGADPARLCTSPPGIDHDVFSPGDRAQARERVGWDIDRPHALFVGRIQPLKGVDVALEAAALVAAEIPGFRLTIVGGPSGQDGQAEFDRLCDRAQMADLVDVVDFVPPVAHRELADFYRAADLVVLPSRSESFGLVAAEAQSSGIPVVASCVGGLEYVVSHGRSGLLVEGWSPEAYSRSMIHVLTDRALAERLSKGALRWSERFSWDSTANRFLELYSGAVDRASHL